MPGLPSSRRRLDFGLIIIDEEHETTFKQETIPRYHAREVARKRAELLGIPLVLGSATPMLESWWQAQQGAFQLLSMPSRIEKLPMPPVVIVDVLNDPLIRHGHNIGRALKTGIDQALKNQGQIILVLQPARVHTGLVVSPVWRKAELPPLYDEPDVA